MSRNSRARERRKTRRMVTCAILAALSTVLLALGTALHADLTAACMAGLVILLVHLCYDRRCALMTYAVTTVLAAIFLTMGTGTWFYGLLLGYYPIVHILLSRLPRVIGWLFKLLLVVAVAAACLLVFHYLFFGGQGTLYQTAVAMFGLGGGGLYVMLGSAALELLVLVLYDILLARLILIYPWRIRPVVERFLKS